MIPMSNLQSNFESNFRMRQQLVHEILYRQQLMQCMHDPFGTMMTPLPFTRQILMPSHPPLPGVIAKLENNQLWQQFHKIGTEMIITKSGRRMFPSMRVSLKGLEEESQYCVLIEMILIGDCRYKFSGSQWLPAGGAEPQSLRRIYLHPDSPATGSHWQAQPILFNKVKLTNNTLDNRGHIVLASMHKYQPRIHVICTNDLTQITWVPQQAFVFPETEFVAVTAYQNDRITKLKIDNNPFAKGFRETGQSKCRRKITLSPPPSEDNQNKSSHCEDYQSCVPSSQNLLQAKRLSIHEEELCYMDFNNDMPFTFPKTMNDMILPTVFTQLSQQPMPMFMPSLPSYMQTLPLVPQCPYGNLCSEHNFRTANKGEFGQVPPLRDDNKPELFVDVVSTSFEESQESTKSSTTSLPDCDVPIRTNSFSISSILANNTCTVPV